MDVLIRVKIKLLNKMMVHMCMYNMVQASKHGLMVQLMLASGVMDSRMVMVKKILLMKVISIKVNGKTD